MVHIQITIRCKLLEEENRLRIMLKSLSHPPLLRKDGVIFSR